MNNTLTIKALLILNETSEGGKSVNYKSGVMPNHFIPELGCFTVGKVNLINKETISSGEEAEVEITFLDGDAIKSIIKEGYEWPIHEGPSWCIGQGKVLKILNKP